MVRLPKFKVNPILAGLLILVILTVGALVVKSVQQNTTPDTSTPTPTPTGVAKQLGVSNVKLLTINDKSFIVPQNWNITVMYGSATNTGYECLTSADCQLAIITNDAQGAALHQLVVSWPFPVVSAGFDSVADQTPKLSFLGETVTFNASKYYVDDSSLSKAENELNAKAYAQIYGCTQGKMCVYAELTESDVTKNAKQYADFQYFLQNFKQK